MHFTVAPSSPKKVMKKQLKRRNQLNPLQGKELLKEKLNQKVRRTRMRAQILLKTRKAKARRQRLLSLQAP